MDDFIKKIQNYDTHTSMHTHQSDVDIMERMLSKDVTSNSSFSENVDVDKLIKSALYQNQDYINDWLQKSKQWDRKGFHCTADQIVGTGIRMDTQTTLIKEYETNVLNVVLKKDQKSEYGFSLVTAYPNIIQSDAKPTERDLRPIMRETTHYKNADPVIQTALDYRADPRSKIGITVQTAKPNPEQPENDSAIFISIPDKEDPELTHVLRLKEQMFSLSSTREIINEKGRAIRQKTGSKYVDIRNEQRPLRLAPVHMNKAMREIFFQDYPEELKCADHLRKKIVQKLPPERNPYIERNPYKQIPEKSINKYLKNQ